jgi:hypothetical protein
MLLLLPLLLLRISPQARVKHILLLPLLLLLAARLRVQNTADIAKPLIPSLLHVL